MNNLVPQWATSREMPCFAAVQGYAHWRTTMAFIMLILCMAFEMAAILCLLYAKGERDAVMCTG
jgi:hypothetical protein